MASFTQQLYVQSIIKAPWFLYYRVCKTQKSVCKVDVSTSTLKWKGQVLLSSLKQIFSCLGKKKKLWFSDIGQQTVKFVILEKRVISNLRPTVAPTYCLRSFQATVQRECKQNHAVTLHQGDRIGRFGRTRKE